jgi:enoyl-CoA hydratase/carnithine racemase
LVTFGTLEKPEPIVTRPNPSLQIDEHDIGWLILNDPERRLNVLTEAVMRRLATLVEGTNRLVAAVLRGLQRVIRAACVVQTAGAA